MTPIPRPCARDLPSYPDTVGKRLVIEYPSAWINAAGTSGLLATSRSTGGYANDLTCRAQGASSLDHIYSRATPMEMYLEPGATLTFSMQIFDAPAGPHPST